MNYRLLLVLLFATILQPLSTYSQAGIPCDSLKASTTCESAPIICDIDCLDGFSATMPDYLDDTLRNILCPGSGGNPSNMSWFAFVAGSSTIQLEILLDNCLVGSQSTNNILGVQAGIYSSCVIDVDGNVDPDIVLDCYNPNTASVSNFTVSSNDFQIGEVYYFFIDGYQGTICDYEVNVVMGAQPFELDNPTLILSSDTLPVDTICLGYRDYILRPNLNPLNIDYYWKITPATPDYPDTFRLLSYNTSWDFNTAGEYTIEFYASNGCDETDTLQHTIMVVQEPDEIFDTVGVCFNKFPFDGPQDVDPNGDGFIGWAGPSISYPGGDVVHREVRPNGCFFDQRINVQEISPKPRENITIYSCGPLDFFGNIITQTQLGIDFDVSNAGEGDCDSLVTLDAYIIDLQSDITVRICDSLGLLLGLDITMLEAPPGHTIEIDWFNTLGLLIDNDQVEDDILITERESYSAIIYIINGLDTCTFNVPSKLIDPDDNRPSITAVDWSLSVCDDDNIGTYQITSDQPIKSLVWSIPSGATYLTGNINSEYIELDFTNSTGGILAVEVENFCSGKTPLSFPIEKVETPIASFDLQSEICIDSTFIIESNESPNSGFQYIWNIPSNAIVLNGSLTSPGPIELTFISGQGDQNVELIIANGRCLDTQRHIINLLPKIPELQLNCEPKANSVLITWSPEACAESYTIYEGGMEIAIITDPFYEFINLPNNAMLDIQVEINSNCQCSGPRSSMSCMTLDCNSIDLDITFPENDLCEDLWINNIITSTYISGGNGSGTFSFYGDHVNGDGSFDALSAGEGIHKAYAQFEEDGCIYVDSTEITLNSNPILQSDYYNPQCIDDILGGFELFVSNGDGNYSYFLDDLPSTDQQSDIDIGSHTIEVIDGNLCNVIENFTINPAPIITYDILGATPIFESEVMTVNLNFTMTETSIVDSVVWLIDGVKYCSDKNCNSTIVTNLKPGTYTHTILIYYNDCILEEEYLVLVKENANVFVPNIFSPNGDGINDFWKIETNDPDLIVNDVAIFNRWGNKVFAMYDFKPYGITELWDGTFNGRKVQPGVFVIVVNYIDQFGEVKIMHSNITIFN